MEEILKRINLIIQKEGISPSIFADSLEIGRPLLSHVLSGRNNPSLQLILKILEKYPTYSANWLIGGSENETAKPVEKPIEEKQTIKEPTTAITKQQASPVTPPTAIDGETIIVMHADRTYTSFKPRK